jgi:aldehyde dehydrogenase (NAD+)
MAKAGRFTSFSIVWWMCAARYFPAAESLKRAHKIAGQIKAGTVWINTYRAVSFLMPFGGYKASGLGRENGAEAIDGYLQSKSVWIKNGPAGGNPFIMKTAS